MSVRPFRMSAASFDALARGGGGADGMRVLVAARRSRTLLFIRSILAARPALQPDFDLLSEVQRKAPQAVSAVLDHPAVGVWAAQTAVALVHGEPAAPERLGEVAIAAVERASHGPGFPLPPPLGRNVVTELDVGDGVTFQLDPWQGGGLPDGLRISRDADPGLWREWITLGWHLLAQAHPGVATEFAEAVSVITPLRSSPAGFSSATLADAFGCVFMSLTRDPEVIGLAFAHELQHTKLAGLMDLFPLLRPGRHGTFYAPWRPEPRPLVGLLHGTYAHLGVAGFWRRQRVQDGGPHADVEFSHWRAAGLLGCRTLLASGGLTAVGERFVLGMQDVLLDWAAEPVPASAIATAEERMREHRDLWLASVHSGSS
ncbi:hypothetical protein JOF56_006675 [Kibdelosporangium banguiense]|uniref:HEXXH motif-containing protein n=1 Tax=Kibdelosporangium banguiense TaxID=1365924 RepID=A0ABS4TPG0_9PSEU|nr:HEXXH motif-containing putative peptide modification protein [Kibdelosporangium banguiense]MBP2326290.1 hypothetical protein [Kibdelosporangium banguiense]